MAAAGAPKNRAVFRSLDRMTPMNEAIRSREGLVCIDRRCAPPQVTATLRHRNLSIRAPCSERSKQGLDVKLDVVRRRFAKIDDQWGEVEDLRRRELSYERSGSSFCIFFPAGKADLLASLRQRAPRSHVQTVSSPSQEGPGCLAPIITWKCCSLLMRVRQGDRGEYTERCPNPQRGHVGVELWSRFALSRMRFKRSSCDCSRLNSDSSRS